MLQLRNPFYIFVLALLFYRSQENFPEVIDRIHKLGLAKNSAPSFKTRPDRLSKLAALDTLVFFKTFKMVFSGTVTRLKESV